MFAAIDAGLFPLFVAYRQNLSLEIRLAARRHRYSLSDKTCSLPTIPINDSIMLRYPGVKMNAAGSHSPNDPTGSYRPALACKLLLSGPTQNIPQIILRPEHPLRPLRQPVQVACLRYRKSGLRVCRPFNNIAVDWESSLSYLRKKSLPEDTYRSQLPRCKGRASDRIMVFSWVSNDTSRLIRVYCANGSHLLPTCPINITICFRATSTTAFADMLLSG